MQRGHIHTAMLCLPESVSSLSHELLQHPIAITPQPLVASVQRDGEVQEWELPCRSLFVYMTADKPDVDGFAAAFRSLAAVFMPVLCR